MKGFCWEYVGNMKGIWKEYEENVEGFCWEYLRNMKRICKDSLETFFLCVH